MVTLKKYQQAAVNVIHGLARGSFCMAVGNFYELLGKDSNYDKYGPLKEIKDGLFDMYLNLGDILSEEEGLDSEKREKYKDICYEFRNRLADINIRISALRGIINKKVLLFRYYFLQSDPELKGSTIDFGLVKETLADCYDSISTLDEHERVTLMSSLMGHIPLRIARGLYFDYISKNLTEAFAYLSEGEIDSYIEFCKIYFEPDKTGANILSFTDIADKIRKLDAYDEYLTPGAVISDDISGMFQSEIDALSDELSNVSYLITVLFETVNYLLIITSLATGLDYLTEDNFIVRDLYFLVKEARNNDEFAFDDDIFEEKIEAETLNVLDSIDALCSVLKKELKAVKHSLKNMDSTGFEDSDKFLFMFGFAYQLFNEALYDIDAIMFKSGRPGVDKDADRYAHVSQDFVKAKIEDLTEIIKASSPGATPRDRRMERQFFMAYVPCFFTCDEYRAYIENSFDNASQVEVISSLTYIHEYLDMYGLGTKNPNDLDELAGENACDCGDHNHHHTHICGGNDYEES